MSVLQDRSWRCIMLAAGKNAHERNRQIAHKMTVLPAVNL